MKERQITNKESVVIFDRDVNDAQLDIIPDNFTGDIVINGDFHQNTTKSRIIPGNLYVTGNMYCNLNSLTINGKLTCYGNIVYHGESTTLRCDLTTKGGGIFCFGNIGRTYCPCHDKDDENNDRVLMPLGNITSNGDIIARKIEAFHITSNGTICALNINSRSIKCSENIYSKFSINADNITVAGNVECNNCINLPHTGTFIRYNGGIYVCGYVKASYIYLNGNDMHVGKIKNNMTIVNGGKVTIVKNGVIIVNMQTGS